MVKSPLVCCNDREVSFLRSAFCLMECSNRKKMILILLRSFLRDFALVRNFAVESAAAHKVLLPPMPQFRKGDAHRSATMKHTQPDFLCLQLLLFLYLCLVFAAETVGCRVCRVDRILFATRMPVAGAASHVLRMPPALPPSSTLENPWMSSVSYS